MLEIKTRSTAKDIKILDKGATISKNMKDAFIKTKDKIEETQEPTHNTPHAYATDKASKNAKEVASFTAYKVEHFGSKSFKNTPNSIMKTKSFIKAIKNTAKRTVDSYKSTIKTAKSTIKTTRNTAKATIEATQTTVKASQKALQTAKAVVKATAQLTKATAKAFVISVKAAITAVKGIVSLIAAGGWIAVAIILIICMVGLIIASPFGVFTDKRTENGYTLSQAVEILSCEWQASIENTIKDAGSVEKAEYFLNGVNQSDPSVSNIKDVFAVFAVKETTSPNRSYFELSDETIPMLRTVFNDMNSYKGKIVEQSIDGKTHKTLQIDIECKYYLDMAREYGFNQNQIKDLEFLMNEIKNSFGLK